MGDERGHPGPASRKSVPGLPRRLAATAGTLSMSKELGTWDGCSHVSARSPRTRPRVSGHPEEARAAAISKPTPTPAERYQRTAGVTLLLPNPNCLQVPRVLSKLVRSEPRPRGMAAPSRAATARPCVPGVATWQRQPDTGCCERMRKGAGAAPAGGRRANSRRR